MQASAAEDDPQRVEGLCLRRHQDCGCPGGFNRFFPAQQGNQAAGLVGHGLGMPGVGYQCPVEQFDGLGMIAVICGKDAKQVEGICRRRIGFQDLHAQGMGAPIVALGEAVRSFGNEIRFDSQPP